MEWLNSPIVYRERIEDMFAIRRITPEYFDADRATYHYWSMAKSNFESYLTRNEVSYKKYLYAIRPLLACRSLSERHRWPSIVFDELVNDFLPEVEVRDRVEWLLRMKRHGAESDHGAPDKILHAWLEVELERQRPKRITESRTPSSEPLDRIFAELVLSPS